MMLIALVPVLLVASCQAGELLAQAEPLQQFTQSQNTATGEYGFSYSGGPSAKTEYRALDGTTTGTYSYVDANGQLQSVSYIADEEGFRATGTNIPQARKKRGILYQPATFAALPAASSSQNRFQIHNDARLIQRTEIHAPIYQAAAPVALHAPAALLYRKKRGILAAAEPLPLAYAAAPALPLPPSSAKIYNEFNQQRPTLYAAAAPAPALVHAAPAAVAPIVHAAPVAPLVHAAPIIEQAPISRSSQNRFQVHKDSKIIEEIHTPLYPALQYAAYAAPALALQPAQPAQLIQQQQQQHHFIGAAPQPAFGIGTVTAVGAPPSQPLPAGPIAAEPARPAPAPAAPAAVSDDAITVESA